MSSKEDNELKKIYKYLDKLVDLITLQQVQIMRMNDDIKKIMIGEKKVVKSGLEDINYIR